MDPEAYLERIGHRGDRAPTEDTLRCLHRAHMFSVPFENLDICLGRPIVLSLPPLYKKIVGSRRGGFCYELNGLFGWLLRELGFDVEWLSGRVLQKGEPGPEYDHMLLLVGLEQRWVADVGFGDSFVEPLPLDRGVREQAGRSYRLVERSGEWTLQRRRATAAWEAQYVFSSKSRELSAFEAMCTWQQTSPRSVFTHKSVCSLATRDGRVTLSNGRLIVTSEDRRCEQQVANTSELRALLKNRFGVDLGSAVALERILSPESPSPS